MTIAYRSRWVADIISWGPKCPLFSVPFPDLEPPPHVAAELKANPGATVVCLDRPVPVILDVRQPK